MMHIVMKLRLEVCDLGDLGAEIGYDNDHYRHPFAAPEGHQRGWVRRVITVIRVGKNGHFGGGCAILSGIVLTGLLVDVSYVAYFT